MTYDIAVLIGRFQPFHLGHLHLVETALEKADRLLILLGSHRCAPDTRNPWSSEERQEMIAAVLTAEQLRRVTFIPLRDHLYSDNLWLADVQQKVLAESEEGDRVVLVAHRQGRSSSYLDLFPQWDLEEVPVQGEIRSSAIREAFFSDAGPEVWGLDLPAGVHFLLEAYRGTGRYRWLREEEEYLRRYRESWAVAPYPPTFVTTDAVVVQSGHVLVVRRRVRPGAGLIALPGGYLGQRRDGGGGDAARTARGDRPEGAQARAGGFDRRQPGLRCTGALTAGTGDHPCLPVPAQARPPAGGARRR